MSLRPKTLDTPSRPSGLRRAWTWLCATACCITVIGCGASQAPRDNAAGVAPPEAADKAGAEEKDAMPREEPEQDNGDDEDHGEAVERELKEQLAKKKKIEDAQADPGTNNPRPKNPEAKKEPKKDMANDPQSIDELDKTGDGNGDATRIEQFETDVGEVQAGARPEPIAVSPASAEDDGFSGIELETSGSGSSWARKRARRRVEQAKQSIEDAASGPTGAQDLGMPACQTTCRAADAVCESRDTICDIAKQYRDEQEFRTDCTWAEDECASAQKRCDICEASR